MNNMQEMLDECSLFRVDELKQRLSNYTKHLSKSDIKSLKKRIDSGANFDKICIAVLAYVYFCRDEAIIELRRSGLFSYWRNYDSNVYSVEKIISCIVSQLDWLKLSDVNKEYLHRKEQYSWIGKWLLETQQQVDETIRQHHNNRIKDVYDGNVFETSLYRELISYIDFTFLSSEWQNVADDSNCNVLKSYSKEFIASAVSFLIFRYIKTIGKPKINAWIDAEYVLSEDIESLILLACKFIQLNEWELLWDYYGYNISDDGVIYSNDELLEKTIRLGYIDTQCQEVIFFKSVFKELSKEKIALLTMYKDLLEKEKDTADSLIVSSGQGIFERYIVKNYIPFFYMLGSGHQEKKVIYGEEEAMLNYMSKELSVPVVKLLDWKVIDNSFDI